MSEYQYYEFQALDRPLTQPQMAAMTDQAHAFVSRMEALCREHSKKPTLVERFRKTNLLG